MRGRGMHTEERRGETLRDWLRLHSEGGCCSWLIVPPAVKTVTQAERFLLVQEGESDPSLRQRVIWV